MTYFCFPSPDLSSHHAGGRLFFIIALIILLLCCYYLTYNSVDFITEPVFDCNISACKLSINVISESSILKPHPQVLLKWKGVANEIANSKCRCGCQNSMQARTGNYYFTSDGQIHRELVYVSNEYRRSCVLLFPASVAGWASRVSSAYIIPCLNKACLGYI